MTGLALLRRLNYRRIALTDGDKREDVGVMLPAARCGSSAGWASSSAVKPDAHPAPSRFGWPTSPPWGGETAQALHGGASSRTSSFTDA